jgi:Uma2 family endonuclease
MNILTKPLITPEDLEQMPGGERYELVDSHLKELDVGAESNHISAVVIFFLQLFLREHFLGWVLASDTQYQCFPHAPKMVRKPDVSFIRRERIPDSRLPRGLVRIRPDLAVEVVSPKDEFEEVDVKVEDYLRAGIPLVWIVVPATRQVYVHRPDGSVVKVRENGELTGEDVLPGFRCRVAELFATLAPAIPPEQSATSGD